MFDDGKTEKVKSWRKRGFFILSYILALMLSAVWFYQTYSIEPILVGLGSFTFLISELESL